MPSADILARFGILVRHGFLSDDLCQQVVAGIRSGEGSKGTVGNDQGDYVVDESSRRVSQIEVGEETSALIEVPLRELKPVLEEHFHVALSHYQRPTFLSYGIGDYYVPHTDSRDDNVDSVSRERKVSVVIFLNHPSEKEAEGCYGGGELTFFGLMTAPGMEARGLPLVAERGLLVAFRSDLVHQVTPITHGQRFSIVTWYASGGNQTIHSTAAGKLQNAT
jgi:SM-20-related protein